MARPRRNHASEDSELREARMRTASRRIQEINDELDKIMEGYREDRLAHFVEGTGLVVGGYAANDGDGRVAYQVSKIDFGVIMDAHRIRSTIIRVFGRPLLRSGEPSKSREEWITNPVPLTAAQAEAYPLPPKDMGELQRKILEELV